MIQKYYSDLDEVKNDTEILEIFNIIKNPTYIYLKGIAEIGWFYDLFRT